MNPELKWIIRKVSHKLSYNKRYLRLTSHEQVEIRKIKKLIYIFLIKLNIDKKDLKVYDKKQLDKLTLCLKLCIIKYLSITIADPSTVDKYHRPARTNRTIASFTRASSFNYFRFHRNHLELLKTLLKFPEIVRFSNRSKMKGEEILLRGLYELCSGECQHKIADNLFGRHMSDQSRAFKWFINHIYDNFSNLVLNNLEWWYRNGFFTVSADAIESKMQLRSSYGKKRVGHFIDCNCLSTSVVGGGPTEDGANSARWHDNIQRAFYNGWKSVHGLKHQTVDNAFGCTVDTIGPTSLRRNDNTLLRLSNINDRMKESNFKKKKKKKIWSVLLL